MSVLVQPQKASIYQGQPFTFDIKISKNIQALHAFLIGDFILKNRKVYSLFNKSITKNSSKSYFSSSTHYVCSPIFKHVLNSHNQQHILLKVDFNNLPPSILASTFVMSYKLLLVYQYQSYQILEIPLFLFSDPSLNSSINLKPNFNIIFQPSVSEHNKYDIPSPYFSNGLISPQKYSIQIDKDILEIETSLFVQAGSEFTGIVDLSKVSSSIRLNKILIKILRKEEWTNGQYIEENNIVDNDLSLVSVIMKRFYLPIENSFQEFHNEFVDVSYIVEFIINADSGSWQWETQLHILPPSFSGSHNFVSI